MIVETKCPFCTREIACNAEIEPPIVTHGMPPCEAFINSKDALDFIRKVNAELKRKSS